MTTVLSDAFPISPWLLKDESARRGLIDILRNEAVRVHTARFGSAPTEHLRFSYARHVDQLDGTTVYEIQVGV